MRRRNAMITGTTNQTAVLAGQEREPQSRIAAEFQE
jgi:hypothetical protein